MKNRNVRCSTFHVRPLLPKTVMFWLSVTTISGSDAIINVARSADPSTTHIVANGWQETDFLNASNPGCSIGSNGSVSGGRLMMGADSVRPDPMNMVIRKSGWQIPAGTAVLVKASFPDGAIMQFAGRGNGAKIEMDLNPDQVRSWVHELTTNSTMQVSFGGNEPPWTFDLNGTTTVLDAMSRCFVSHDITRVAPPLNGSNTATANAAESAPMSSDPGQRRETLNHPTQPFGPGSAPTEDQSNDAKAIIEIFFSLERSFLAGDSRMPEALLSYNRCFIPKIQYGQFSSYDGGKSSLQLEQSCMKEAFAVISDCETGMGKHPAIESEMCSVLPGYLTQAALKLMGK